MYKDKAEHSFTVLTQLTDVAKKENYHSAACSVCGRTIDQAHTWVKDEAASRVSTCTQAGENVFICACGAEKRDALPLAPHDYEEQTTLEPTCTVAGTKSQVCKVCGHSENDVPIDPLGHDFVSEWSSDDDNHWHVCSRAEENDDTHEKGSLAAHTYEWKSDGTNHWQQCNVCNHVKESSRAGHTYGDWSDDGDNGHTHTCTVCGYSETVAHAYNAEPDSVTPATCTEPGQKNWICTAENCNHQKTETIGALGHDFAVEWTRDENGHWHVCSRAGGDDQHTKGSYSVHNNVVRFDNTYHWEECSVCGYNSGGEIRKNQHEAGAEWQKDGAQHWHKCIGCDYRLDVASHEVDPDKPWVSGNAVSHYHTCTVCGGHADEEAHTYGEWTVTKEATETEEGSRERTCSVCGYIQTDVIAKHVKPTEDKKADDGNTPVPPPSNTITAETKNVVLVTKNAYSITGGMTPVAASGKKNANPYTVGNPKILKIDKNGNIKVKKAGTTTITFTTADGVTHTVTVTVEKPKKQNRTITDPNKTVIDAGDLLKGAKYSVPDTVTSTKTGVATIGSDGKIHIVGKGTTKIKYTFGKLKVKATLKVKVEPNKASDSGNDGKSAGETAAVEDNIRVDPGIGEEISHTPEECVEIINDAMEIYPVEVTDEAADEAADESTCD